MVELRPDAARELARYNRAVFGRFERAVRRRGWVEATRDRGTGHGSLKNTLVHILNVHEAWMVAIPARDWSVFDRPGRQPKDVTTWRMFSAYRDRVWSGTDGLLATLTPRRLRGGVRAPWMAGRYTLGDAFLQTTIEQAHHLGEVIGVFWQNNWSPPPMTWIENRASARPRS